MLSSRVARVGRPARWPHDGHTIGKCQSFDSIWVRESEVLRRVRCLTSIQRLDQSRPHVSVFDRTIAAGSGRRLRDVGCSGTELAPGVAGGCGWRTTTSRRTKPVAEDRRPTRIIKPHQNVAAAVAPAARSFAAATRSGRDEAPTPAIAANRNSVWAFAVKHLPALRDHLRAEAPNGIYQRAAAWPPPE